MMQNTGFFSKLGHKKYHHCQNQNIKIFMLKMNKKKKVLIK